MTTPAPTILALDLSVTSTGVAVLETSRPPTAWQRFTLRTRSRPKDRPEFLHDLARYRDFAPPLAGLLQTYRPEVLAVEITRHAHQYGGGKRTTKGREFNAGLYLGLARGWLGGALQLAQAYGLSLPEIDLIESSAAKQAVTGNQAASKEAVRDFLAEQLGLDLSRWGADEVDALAVGVTAARLRCIAIGGSAPFP